MTDITDQDRRDMRDWARGMRHNPDSLPGGLSKKIADHILDTVEAPTLSEDLTNIAEHWETWTTPAITTTLTSAASRAKQMEQDAEERQEWNRHITEQTATIARERDEARAQVELRNLQIDRQQQLMDLHGVPRDTVVLPGPDTVQKGAESDLPNPADVKPGEAWLVKVDGRNAVGVRDGVFPTPPWSVIDTDYGGGSRLGDSSVTLVSRLVPDTRRIITDPDELAEIRGFAIGMTARTDEVWQPGLYGWHSPNRTGKFSSKDIIERFGPMTILHDPEAE